MRFLIDHPGSPSSLSGIVHPVSIELLAAA
jgi:hypothetical protein